MNEQDKFYKLVFQKPNNGVIEFFATVDGVDVAIPLDSGSNAQIDPEIQQGIKENASFFDYPMRTYAPDHWAQLGLDFGQLIGEFRLSTQGSCGGWELVFFASKRKEVEAIIESFNHDLGPYGLEIHELPSDDALHFLGAGQAGAV